VIGRSPALLAGHDRWSTAEGDEGRSLGLRRFLQVFALGVVLLVFGTTGGQAADSFNPTSISVVLAPGASWKTSQALHLDSLPPKADIVVAVDTTGSMGTAIANAKADATNIVNRVKASIPGARFAVVDFKDYPIPPYGDAGDYPYRLKTGLTSNASTVQTAVNGLTVGGGNDLPESINRVLFETYSDTQPHSGESPPPHLAYDAEAPRFLIVLADDIGHDSTQKQAFPGCANTFDNYGLDGFPGTEDDALTPRDDLGRNGVVGGGDDPRTKATLDALKVANTNVSFVTYNPTGGTPGTPQCHAEMALYAGGLQVTHGATDSLAGEIVTLVKEAAARVDKVALVVSPPETGASAAGWPISFSPPGPYGPFDAPRDVPYEMRVTVPTGTATGTYKFNVTAVADGSPRAEQLVTIDVRSKAATALTLTVDERSTRAGVASLPFSAIPASRIPFLGGTTSALPAGSIPAGSIPAGSIPAGSIPAGSIPAGSIPAGSIPAGSIPAGSIPAGSIPYGSIGLGDTPAGSIPAGSIALRHVMVSQIPLRNVTWDEIVAPPSELHGCGTSVTAAPYSGACRPLTTLTLEDIANDSVALGRLNALPIEDVPLFSTLWRDAPFAAMLLGNATLSQLPPPPPHASWGAAIEANGGSSSNLNASTNTVFGVYVAGQLGSTPAGSIPAGSIPYGSIPAGSIPAGSIPAGSIALGMTRLGAVLISELPPTNLADFVNCSGAFVCTAKTLGQADDAGAINPGLTIAQLFAALPANHPALETTLDQLIAAMLPFSNYPWEEIAVTGLQDVADTAPLHYHVDFELNCSLAQTFDITVNLPGGFFPVLGSTTFQYAGGGAVAGKNPTANDGGDYVFKPDGTTPCPTPNAVRHVRMNFNAYAGLTLGDHASDATVTTATQTETVNDKAPVLVLQNHEANDDPLTSPVIAQDTLVVGHVADGSDREYFRIPFGNLPRHSKLVAYLNVPDGADFDLVVHKQFSPSLQSSPAGSIPAGSIPVEDSGVSVDNTGNDLPPETLADIPAGSIPAGSIPAGSIPAGSISANRGAATEAAQIVKRDEQGEAIVSISGFNGSHSGKPYVLRLQVVDPPPLPACPDVTGLATATPGTLPAASTLPAGTKTLFLINRQRLVGLYNEDDVDALLDAGSPLRTVAARPEVSGAVIAVDGDADVRAAYTAWDDNSCSVDAANQVVREINDVIATYRAELPQLRHIVVLGSDEAIPMYRQDDLTSLSPELDEASDLAFTTNDLTAGNALYASAAQNTVLTDGAYGAFTQLTWLGHDLPLAQTPVARVLERPGEIAGQFQQYLDSNGLLDPKSELTTGYDFLTDGATDIHDGLVAQFPGIAPNTLIPTGADPQWQRGDLIAKYFGKTKIGADGNPVPDVPDIVSPNAHYSHWLAQPAGPASITDLSQMVTSADVPGAGAIAGRIVFTMGCHGGLNVPDRLSSDTARRDDWTQRYLRSKTAVYIANTGFGYGDTVTVALTERLLRLFSQKLNSANTTVGEQWIDALQTYYLTAGDYDVFDEKAMIEATFYGLPFYRFRTPGSSSTPTPPSTTPDGTVDVASLAAISPSPTPQTLPDGRKWWEIGGETLNVPYRPIQPLLSKEVTVSGKSARGVWIRSLATHDVPNVKPLLAYPRVDSQAREPDPDFRGTFWPANVVSLLRTNTLGQERASVVVKAGQFRPNTSGNLGTERLVNAIGLDVAYSSATDTTPPELLQVGGVIHDGGTTFFVRLKDPATTIKKVAVLYNDGTQANWTFRALQHLSGDLWTIREPGLTTPTHIVGQAMKLTGVTGFGANKGENHTSFTDPPSDGPDIVIESPRAGAVFAPNEAVTPDFSCSDEGGVRRCDGAILVGGLVDTGTSGPRTFSVTAVDLAGNVSTKTVPYYVRYEFQGFKPPVDNPLVVNVAKLGSTIPIKWSLLDVSGRYVSDLNVVTSVTSEKIKCPSATTDPIEETTTLGLTALKYDTANNHYVYSWQTQKSWGTGCRRVYVAFDDGSPPRFADFQLK
jgi:hypothetical protein